MPLEQHNFCVADKLTDSKVCPAYSRERTSHRLSLYLCVGMETAFLLLGLNTRDHFRRMGNPALLELKPGRYGLSGILIDSSHHQRLMAIPRS